MKAVTACGAIWLAWAVLVNPSSAHANNSFTNRVVLTGGAVTVAGNNVAATLEPNEPVIWSNYTKTVWYEWTAPASGWLTTEVQASFFSSTHIWRGDSLSNLTHLGTANNRSTNGSVIFIGPRPVHAYPHGDGEVEAGANYKISVASAEGGPFRLTLTLATLRITSPTNLALLTQASALPLVLSPPNADIDGTLRGVRFSLGLDRTNLVTNTWPYGPIPVQPHWVFLPTNATNLSVLASNVFPENYVVTARATNQAGREILTPPTYFRVRAVNDDFAAATVITNLPFAAPHYFINATNEPGEPVLASQAHGASVWWRWTAPSNGTVAVLGEAAYGVFTGDAIDALTAIAAGFRDVRFAATAGTTYHFKAARLGTNTAGTLPNGTDFRLYWVPLNDAFESRIALSGGSVAVVGDNSAAGEGSTDPMLPDSYSPQRRTVWYSWTAPVSGQANIQITCLGERMSASAWIGDILTNLQLAAWTDFSKPSSPWGCIFCPPAGPTRGWLRFAVDAGQSYQLCFAGSGSEFNFYIDLCSVTITNPPNGSVMDGNMDMLLVQATSPHADIEGEVGGIRLNASAPSTDWWDYGWWMSVPITNIDNISVVFSNLPPNDYSFHLQMTNAAGRLLVSRTNHVRLRPLNDDFAAAYVLSSNYFHQFTLAGASEEPDEPIVPEQSESRSIWYRWTSPVDTVVLAYAPAKAVGVFTGATLNSLQPVANTSIEGRVRFECSRGETYHFKVSPTTDYKLGYFLLSSLWPNDDFSGRVALTGTDISLVISNVPASIEPHEPPFHTNLDTSFSFRGSLWWTWTAPTNGALYVDGVPPWEPWDLEYVYFHAYTGNSLEALVLKEPEIDDGSIGLRYRVRTGEALQIRSGANYETREFRLRFIPDPPPRQLSVSQLTGESCILAFVDEPGHRYALESSTDLEHWYELMVIDGTDMPIYFGPVYPEGTVFYRARRLEPAPPLE